MSDDLAWQSLLSRTWWARPGAKTDAVHLFDGMLDAMPWACTVLFDLSEQLQRYSTARHRIEQFLLFVEGVL